MSRHLDPELLRKKVGQYADRWYIDPLPSCPIAKADPALAVPSVSTIKKAASKDWTQVSMGRAAQWIADSRPVFDGDEDQIKKQLLDATGSGLDLAASRGTQIHSMFEAYADGLDPMSVEVQAEAARYRRTVLRCISDMKPKITRSEFVCVSRTHGYAGTADAEWEIDGELWLVDYKSRAAKHAAYLEEAWQVAGYARADYGIDATPKGEMHRFELPKFAGGLILSLTPDGYRFYPVALDEAFEGFVHLRQFWALKTAGVKGVYGKPWENPIPTRDAWIRHRIDAIKDIDIKPLLEVWPADVAKPKQQLTPYSDADIDLLVPAVEIAEAAVSAPWPEADPRKPAPKLQPEPKPEPVIEMPAEGDLMPAALIAIEHRYSLLTESQRDWIHSVVAAAAAAHLPIRVAETPTARRVFVARALILAVERAVVPETISTCVAGALGLDDVTTQGGQLGAWVGLLDWEQAATFAALVQIAHPRPDQPPKFAIAARGEPVVTTTKPRKTQPRKKTTA